MADDAGGSASQFQEEQAPAVWPPANDFDSFRELVCRLSDCSTSGGAGSPSTPPMGSSIPVVGATGQIESPVPDVVVYFRGVWTLVVPTPLATAIFEPPRID